VVEARGAFLGGADAIVSSNTFTSLPLIDSETLEFEVQVDGFVSTGGLGGPAILPLSLAKMSQLTQALPDRSFSGIGGISTFDHALNYFLLGCGTVQVCTAAMLDHAIGPNIIKGLNEGLAHFLERHADKGWTRVDDFVAVQEVGKVINPTLAAGQKPNTPFAEIHFSFTMRSSIAWPSRNTLRAASPTTSIPVTEASTPRRPLRNTG
jgi:hypothetical protein